MLRVEAHAVLVEEILILQVVLDHVVHHADAEGRIGAGDDGHPLVGYRLGRLVQPRLNDNDLAALALGVVELVGGVAALVGHPVIAEVEVQLGILDGQRVGRGQHAAGHHDLGNGPRAQRHGTQLVMHRAALGVQQADDLIKIGVPNIAVSSS